MSKLEWRGAINKWQTEPIGGELRPEIQLGIWLDPPRPDAEDFMATAEATHATWLLAHALFVSENIQPGSPVYERAVQGAKRLGYEFYVSAVRLGNPGAGVPLSVTLRIQNRGVAPFYYDWPMQLGVLGASKQLVTTWDVPWRLTQVALPGDQTNAYTELSFVQPQPGLAPGRYTLVLHVVNPLPNGKALRFANASQDADLNGWLSLGALEVRP
jgi:hypothetical protein